MTFLTDIVVDAARTTSDVYTHNVRKIANLSPAHVLKNEMRRAALMDELSKDENLCEMFAGRLRQFGAHVSPLATSINAVEKSRCPRCNGDKYVSGAWPNMPDEPCPACNADAPSGAERVKGEARRE